MTFCSCIQAGTGFFIYLPEFSPDREVTGGVFLDSLDGYDITDFGTNVGSELPDPEIFFLKRTGEDGWDREDMILAKDYRNPLTSFPKVWRVKIWGENLADWLPNVIAWWRTDDPLLEISGTVYYADQLVGLNFETQPLFLLPSAGGYDIAVTISTVPEPSSLLILFFCLPFLPLSRGKRKASRL